MARLPALGFQLADEQPCRFRLDPSRPVLVEDGAQYWVRVAPLPEPPGGRT